MNEQELVELAQAGDRTALGELLLQQYEPLARSLAPKIPNAMQRIISVDDVLQASFAEAYRNIGKFDYRGPGSVRAWLTQIGEFRLMDMIKSQRTKRRGGERAVQEKAKHAADSVAELIDMVSGGVTSPSRVMARKEALHALNLAIGSLPELYSTVIRLRFLEGKSIEETASEIDRSPNAVRSIAHRAKEELREAFGRLSHYLTRD